MNGIGEYNDTCIWDYVYHHLWHIVIQKRAIRGFYEGLKMAQVGYK